MDDVNAPGADRVATPPLALAVLGRILLVWQPLSLALTAGNALSALPLRGAPLGAILVARVAVASLAVAAGLAIANLRPGAVVLARASLIASLAMDLVVYATPYYPNNRMPGDTPLYAAASIVFYGGWLTYLSRSKRVRNLHAS
jgi:hypothetical protein